VTTTVPAVQCTAVVLRHDVILDQMQADCEQAGHVASDVRDCAICCRRYGLDGPAQVHIARRPRPEWGDDLGDDDRNREEA
jgi:hypothetical protein